ncbi:hypothetical protein C3942_05385 [Solimonas fluminis]|uniref:Uncharacterized protein n=1 Tax=Solimonas fluminis TaxID=2086571 RepID=A0A2S5TJE4_9GAMM|nr:hypothetical protein [Solimonas fluminis]PPE75109.1 hypothetical protein C3942_05385 [Solimonas fluminis]
MDKLALPLIVAALLLLGIGCMLTGLFNLDSPAGIVLLVGGFFFGAGSLLVLGFAGRENFG